MADAPAAPSARADDDWRRRLLDDDAAIGALLARTRRIAVLGIKTPDGSPPAHYVPLAAQRAGYTIVPVPVYFPDVDAFLGEPAYRRVADVPPPVDLVVVFRRPADIPAHLDDLRAARPRAVWMQSGIRHAAVAEALAREGIEVVQDRCLMVEIARHGARAP